MNTIFTNITSINHPLIQKYQPQFLALGDENIVFALINEPEKVIKIHMQSILDALLWIGSQDELEEKMKQIAIAQQKKFDTLKIIYEQKHTPQTKVLVLSIPITKEIIDEICRIKKKDISLLQYPSEVFSILILQEKIVIFDNPERLFITSLYSERYDLPEEMYSEITNKLVFDIKVKNTFSTKYFLQIQDIRRNHIYPLFRLIKTMEKSTELKECVKDFITKTVKYVQRTDSILDLAGRHNFAIFPEERNGLKIWTYKIVDVLCFNGDFKISQIKKDFSNLKISRELLDTINFIRVMNGLSDIVGLGKPFDQLDGLNINCATLYKELHSAYGLSKKQSALAQFDLPKI